MDDSMTTALNDELEPAELARQIPEARGPHLPDVLSRVPFGALMFGLLALARLIWFVRETELGPPLTLQVFVAYVGGLVPAVVAILLPSALLLRHPDAWSRARTLLIGASLFAVVEGLRVLSPALQPVFESITPGSEETPYLVPLALAYSSAQALLAAFAVANVGLGLAQARRYLDRRGTLLIVLAAAFVVVVASASRVILVSRVPFDEITMTPTVAVYLASAIVLGILSIGAWAYLAVTAARGARAGEEPGRGWILVAMAAWLIATAFAAGAVAALAEPTPETQGFYTALSQAISVVYTLGYLSLLAALLVGLPSLEPLEDEADDAESDDEDADDADEANDADPFGADEGAGSPAPAEGSIIQGG